MNHAFRRLLPCLCLLAATYGVAAPTSASTSAAGQLLANGRRAAPLETVRITGGSQILNAPLAVALAKGYFDEAGVQADVVPYSSAQDAIVMLATGRLDAVVTSFNSGLFNGVNRGLDIMVVSSMAVNPFQGYPTGLIVRRDLLTSGQVTTLADLRGRKVALSGGPTAGAAYTLATKLHEGGLTLKDVDIVTLGLPEQLIAMQTGAIDAAIPPEPFTHQMILDGSGDLFGGPVTPGRSETGTIVSGGFLREHPAAAAAILVALMRGARDLQGDLYKSRENLAILSSFTHLPIETLRTMDRYDFRPDLAPVDDELMSVQQVFMDEGLLDYAELLPRERLLDTTPWESAVEILGPYQP